MDIRTEGAVNATVVHFSGAADVAAVGSIRAVLAQALEDSRNRVVCNLAAMDFVCSDALGAFISAQQLAAGAGGFLRLVQPQRRIAEILSTTQLNRLFGIYDSVDAAVADPNGSGRR